MRALEIGLKMKTIYGWEKIDILYRRIDDEFLDPLTFNEDSLLGVPGIIDVYRQGKLTISQALDDDNEKVRSLAASLIGSIQTLILISLNPPTKILPTFLILEI